MERLSLDEDFMRLIRDPQLSLHCEDNFQLTATGVDCVFPSS